MWFSAFPAPGRDAYAAVVLYLAEFYLPGTATLAEVTARALRGAEQAVRGGATVRYVQAIFVPQDESCYALYHAESARDVVAAGAEAGLVFDRIVTAHLTSVTAPGGHCARLPS